MANVQSVERAMAVLRCLAGTEAGVSQVAELVGLPKSTVSRLLSTLNDVGAVQQTATGYRVGPLIAEIAGGGSNHDGLVALARPYLVALVDQVGEDAGLSVLHDGEVLYLAQASADAPVQLRDWTGERVPPHCVSSGLVMLAHLPADARRRVLTAPLARLTERTMTSVGKLHRRLDAVARQDAEWVFGEFDEDINSVAAPVFDGDGRVVAALHVHGPAYRFPGAADRDEVAAHVAAAARRMTARLSR